MTTEETRIAPPDHGGGIDAATARWGGTRTDWLDLSTGINPRPYPIPALPPDAWTALPDHAAQCCPGNRRAPLLEHPRQRRPGHAPGASALIARIPALVPPSQVAIHGPTYNEHARAFRACGWTVTDERGTGAGHRPPQQSRWSPASRPRHAVSR